MEGLGYGIDFQWFDWFRRYAGAGVLDLNRVVRRLTGSRVKTQDEIPQGLRLGGFAGVGHHYPSFAKPSGKQPEHSPSLIGDVVRQIWNVVSGMLWIVLSE